tara:strand:- start:532 stop:1278 length:747 start_codon:yes stop_codon:yes gene_type:complete
MLRFIKKVKSFFLPAIYDGYYKDIKSLSTYKKNYQESYLISQYLTEKLKKSSINVRQNAIRNSLLTRIQQSSKRVRVLDFGGGAAELYSWLISNGLPIKKIEYSLFETKSMVAALKIKQSFNIEDIEVFDKLDSQKSFDIIFVGSSLQYFENYDETVSYLSDHCNSLYLEDIPVSENVKFSSLQVNVKNLGSKGLPVWIFNEKELIDDLSKDHLQLTYSENNRDHVKTKNIPKNVECKSKSFIFETPQ